MMSCKIQLACERRHLFQLFFTLWLIFEFTYFLFTGPTKEGAECRKIQKWSPFEVRLILFLFARTFITVFWHHLNQSFHWTRCYILYFSVTMNWIYLPFVLGNLKRLEYSKTTLQDPKLDLGLNPAILD